MSDQAVTIEQPVDAPQNQAVNFEDDGLVEFKIRGTSYLLDPIADLDDLNKVIEPFFVKGVVPAENNTAFLKSIADWFEAKHKSRIGIILADKLYNALVDERERLFDFFGWRRSSNSTSDSTAADSPNEKSADDLQTCQDC